jgi:CRISPR-associated protein Cas1
MYTFYITKDGKIERESNTLVFIGEDFRKHIPVKNVRDIIISAKVSVSSWAMDYLAKLGIIVHVIGLNGDYRSSLIPIGRNETGQVTVKQVELYLDVRRLDIASEFVSGIKHNILRNLRYYNNKNNLDEIVKKVENINIKGDSITSILGTEGNLWSLYYSAFGKMFKGYENFQRKYRPPPDGLNSLISYGNTLLYTSTLTNIIIAGLNPSISYLHEPSDRSFSLALDLADIFKPVIVERISAYLINNNIMEEEDYEGRDGGVYLSENGKIKFLTAYRDRMEKTVKYNNKYLSYNSIILEECYKLKEFVTKGSRYKAFRMWD